MSDENTAMQQENSAATTQPGTDGAPAANQSNTEKTFTQAELDNILKDRLSKAKSGMPTKEELTAFKQWQESQKTEEQKQADAIRLEQEAKQQAIARATAAEAKVACFAKGVKPEFVDDVQALASRLVTDETDLDTALDTVISKYPMFKGSTENPAITTGTKTTGTQLSEQEAYLNRKYKNNPYFKKGQ